MTYSKWMYFYLNFFNSSLGKKSLLKGMDLLFETEDEVRIKAHWFGIWKLLRNPSNPFYKTFTSTF